MDSNDRNDENRMIDVAERQDPTLTVSDHPGARVVALTGEIDILMTGPREQAFTDAAAGAPSLRVVIDMTAVTFCDSIGIGMLLRAAKAAWANKRTVELVGLHAHLARQLDIFGLTPYFRFHPDLEHAELDLVTPRAEKYSGDPLTLHPDPPTYLSEATVPSTAAEQRRAREST
ncbi:STAS domain-containing protein [Phytomonospora sp. NPDC050363]|uniref:STAS domain-containing protein n=1 Tax=Phytomonospora sp. NPDC050363 TaxID=3155642 RepID=UPI0033C17DD1